MLDPFPLRAPPFLVQLAKPVATRLSLHTLPYHVHEILFACLLYTFVGSYISPRLSSRFFSKTYPRLNERTRLNWDVHVVSLVQSVLITGLSAWVLWLGGDEQASKMDWVERVWGYTGTLGMVQALATGYFLWDLVVSLWRIDVFGWGFVIHAFSALFVFGFGFRPFVNYYGPSILLYELSSPFLNFHWFFDKCGMTGSLPQLVNGICLITTFFSCRLVWGSYMTIIVFGDVWKALNYDPTGSTGSLITEKYLYNINYGYSNDTAAPTAAEIKSPSPEESEVMRFVPMYNTDTNQLSQGHLDLHIPLWLAASYLASNVVLHGLNIFWFGRMIETIRKRFDPPFGTRGKVKDEKTRKKMAVTTAADSLTAAGGAADGEPRLGSTSFTTGTGTDSGGSAGTTATTGKRTRRRAY